MENDNIAKKKSFAIVANAYDNNSYVVDIDERKVDLSGLEEAQVTFAIAESKFDQSDSISSYTRSRSSSRGEEQEVDPWDILPEADTGLKWSELTCSGKFLRISWVTARFLGVIVLLYFFICSLGVLQDAFQLIGGRAAGEIFTNSVLVNNPIAGLMIGIVVTVLVQSSSTSTSIVVSMVGSGLLEVRPAIPIIMGANIGTTVTNTLVALTQSMDRSTFRRAFAGATVHDAFNWLTVLILLPIEIITGYLYHATSAMVKGLSHSADSDEPQFLKVITKPLTDLIIQIDSKVIRAIAQESDRQKFPLAKYYCIEKTRNFSQLISDENSTFVDDINSKIFSYDLQIVNDSSSAQYLTWREVLAANSTKCNHAFVGVGLPGNLDEIAAGAILLVGSLLCLIVVLLLLVKILNSLLQGTMASIVRKNINADFPGRFACLTGYVAIFIGAGITVLVQSSSVFTSALTPLVGLGVVTIERVYPLTLGSNIGTTVTSILAALTADANMIQYTMQISLCHLFFNISGILMFYPIPPLRKIPVKIAKGLGNITAKYRWFAIFYLLAMFIALPFFIFGLSLAGTWVLVGVGVPILALLVVVTVINVIQSKRPQWLPTILKNWDFLPKPLHSLQPWDRLLTICCVCYDKEKGCNCKCGCCRNEETVVSAGSSAVLDLSLVSSSNFSRDAPTNFIQITVIDLNDTRTGSEDASQSSRL
jgi:sodium-dependent phosphate cotransporter